MCKKEFTFRTTREISVVASGPEEALRLASQEFHDSEEFCSTSPVAVWDVPEDAVNG